MCGKVDLCNVLYYPICNVLYYPIGNVLYYPICNVLYYPIGNVLYYPIGNLPVTISTEGFGFNGPLLVLSEAPGGNLFAAAGETQLMAPIARQLPEAPKGSQNIPEIISEVTAGAFPRGIDASHANVSPVNGGDVDGSVVVVSGGVDKSAEAAASTVPTLVTAPAARRKGKRDGPRAASIPGAGESVGSTGNVSKELDLFSEMPDFVSDASAHTISKGPPCRLEAPVPGPGDLGHGMGHVIRAPIFLWKIT